MTHEYTPLNAALDAINHAVGRATDADQLLVAAKCRGLMAGYWARWKDSTLRVHAVETTVTAPLVNPSTNRSSRTFITAGKLDVTVSEGSTTIVLDHKTTSDEITDPAGSYWMQLAVENQPSHYMLLEWLNGRKIDKCVWDVIRKPGISPKTLTKADAKTVAATAEYFGRKLAAEDLQHVAEFGRESLDMYEARLAYGCGVERPERFFQRRPVPRLDDELVRYAEELWSNSQEVITARASGRHGKNPGACMLWGRPCKFLGLCSGFDSPDSQKWRRKEQVHVELPGLVGDGRDVITNSRIKSFLTCRQKHHLEYELGLERADAEDAESLYFGTLLHIGLEAYFLQVKKEQEQGELTENGDSYTSITSASAIGATDTAT